MKVLETYDNLTYEITDEQHEKIMQQSVSGEAKGLWLGQDYVSWASIKAIHEKPHGYGQEYSFKPDYEVKQLTGTVWDRTSKDGKKLMITGWKKVNNNYPKSITGNAKVVNGEYVPKYQTWEEAKAAGVV